MKLESLHDLVPQVNDLFGGHLLSLVGLRSRRSVGARVAQTVGTLSVGLLVGAGLSLLLAPKAGRETRGDLRQRLHQASAALDYAGHPTSVRGSTGACGSG